MVPPLIKHYLTIAIRELKMPALSPTMEKGDVKDWIAKEGDKLGPGDVLCTVETDKATIDFNTEEDVYLAKILVPGGTKEVKLGSVIALIADEKGDLANVDSFKPSEAKSEKPQQAQQQQQPQQQQQEEDEYEEVEEEVPGTTDGGAALPKGAKNIQMPSLSPTMKTGNLIKWTVTEGQAVNAGDVIAQIETDKATLDFEYPDDGIIGKLLVPEGTNDVELGTPIAVLVQNKEDMEALKSYTPGGGSAPTKVLVRRKKAKQAQPQQTLQQEQKQRASGERVIASPLAKTVAKEKGVDLAQVQGTGPNGRVIKADVEEFSQRPKPAVQQQSVQQEQQQVQKPQAPSAVPGGEYTDIPTSNVRKIIAQRLTESKRNIPHYYVTVEVTLDALLKVRSDLNKAGEKRGYKLSVNDFLIKAAAQAMKKVPAVNSHWYGDFIRQYNNVDVSVAVSTDNGLITPIIPNAEKKGIAEISEHVKALAEKARQGKLQPHEFIGGTFTISNLGMFGVSEFSAIINPPQSCILAVGGAEKKVIPNESYKGLEGEDKYKVVSVLKATISADHRVVDGATAAQWLQEFKTLVENPLFLML
jgi:pyruvate dehydrogenase E2 component (dihydrolipoamide acetyltransferase)